MGPEWSDIAARVSKRLSWFIDDNDGVSMCNVKVGDNMGICGIYFLHLEGELVYVGQSINVLSRLSKHSKTKVFDSFTIINWPEEYLDTMEKFLIGFLNPKLNVAWRTDV